MKPLWLLLTISLKFTLATGKQNFANDLVMLLKNKIGNDGSFLTRDNEETFTVLVKN